MYAIVKSGGKQYKVTEGLVFETELQNAEKGATVKLDCILYSADDGKVLLGADAAKVKVSAEIVEHGKEKKMIVFKYKAKKNIRKKQGHRQPFTKLRVTGISL